MTPGFTTHESSHGRKQKRTLNIPVNKLQHAVPVQQRYKTTADHKKYHTLDGHCYKDSEACPAPAYRLLAVPITLNTLFAPGFLPLLFLLPGMLSYRYLSGLSLTTFRSLLSEVYSDHTTIASTPLHSRKEECPDHSKEKPDCLSSETRIGKLETTQEYFPAVLFLS